jgi:tRNA uridine 5-carboxymethylaminomethyl modification enzyme
LTESAFTAGLVNEARHARLQEKLRLLEQARSIATGTKLRGIPISQLFKRPDFTARNLPPEIHSLVAAAIWELVETDFKYEGYAARQSEQNRRLECRQNQIIPDGLDYGKIAGLRAETRQKLAALRPTSLGQAARVSGITPTDIAIVSIWLSKNDLHRERLH